MRSANAQEQGYILAEQRRGFWRTIRSWSNADLQASIIRYRMEANAHPRAERFYAVRIRCMKRELHNRAKRNQMHIVR